MEYFARDKGYSFQDLTSAIGNFDYRRALIFQRSFGSVVKELNWGLPRTNPISSGMDGSKPGALNSFFLLNTSTPHTRPR